MDPERRGTSGAGGSLRLRSETATTIHGTVASRRVQLDIISAQQKRLAGYEEAQGQLEWPLEFVPLPAAGNDQWKITLA